MDQLFADPFQIMDQLFADPFQKSLSNRQWRKCLTIDVLISPIYASYTHFTRLMQTKNYYQLKPYGPETILRDFTFRSIWTEVFRKQGYRAYYKGALSSMMLILISRTLQRAIPQDMLEKNYLAVIAAEILESIITYPLQVVQTRYLQDTNKQFKGLIDCFSQIKNSDGVKGFFRGYFTYIICRCFSKCYWVWYRRTYGIGLNNVSDVRRRLYWEIIMGLFDHVISTVNTVQISGLARGGKRILTTFADAFNSIVSNAGIWGLFSGCLIKYMQFSSRKQVFSTIQRLVG